jgi:WD40 repeat protein
MLRDLVVSFSIVTALVAPLVWYAGHPECTLWHSSAHQASAADVSSFSPIIVSRFNYSADGARFLSSYRGEVAGRQSLILHDTTQKTLRFPIAVHDDKCYLAILAPDGLHILYATETGKLCWIDLKSFETVTLEEFSNTDSAMFVAVSISPDGRWLAAVDNIGRISVCDAMGSARTRLPATTNSSVLDLRFSHDGRQLSAAFGNGLIAVWDLEGRGAPKCLRGHNRAATGAVFLPDAKRLISAGLDDSIRIWDLACGREEWRGEFGLQGVKALAVSADGTLAAWAGCGRRIICWDLERHEMKFEIAEHSLLFDHLRQRGRANSLLPIG